MAKLVPPAGLEPTTTRLEGGCSIQLSYGDNPARDSNPNPHHVSLNSLQ